MNFSATLTPEGLEALSDHKCTLQDAGIALHQRVVVENNNGIETPFDLGLRIKNTLDALEQGFMVEPSTRALALFINCEHRLWRLYMDEASLKYNPFLSHWVEAVQRLDKPGKGKQKQEADEGLSPARIAAARVLWIKTLLQQKNLDRWLNYSPAKVYDELVKKGLEKPFNMQPFLQMLVEEGIYETTTEAEAVTSSPPPSAANGQNDDLNTIPKTTEQSSEEAWQKEKDALLWKLREEPDAAIFEITHLPIAIPYLDFLTTLCADRTLEGNNIDRVPIITQYLQHALRTVEAADAPPMEAETTGGGHRAEAEYGKVAQARYVRLLLLFIKSLLRKGLVELDMLYYEIVEITVRYMWIKEVREFKTWAEGGFDGDGTAG